MELSKAPSHPPAPCPRQGEVRRSVSLSGHGAFLLLSVVDSRGGYPGRNVGVVSWRRGLDGTGLGRSLGEAGVIQACVCETKGRGGRRVRHRGGGGEWRSRVRSGMSSRRERGAPWEEAAVWGGAEHLLQGEQGGGGQGPGRSGSISLWG